MQLQTAGPSSLRWVDKFRSLWVLVTKQASSYFGKKNHLPQLSTLNSQCSFLASLPLNLLGHINIIKMMMLPKYNYIFKNGPIWVPDSFFKDFDKMCGFLILEWSSP